MMSAIMPSYWMLFLHLMASRGNQILLSSDILLYTLTPALSRDTMFENFCKKIKVSKAQIPNNMLQLCTNHILELIRKMKLAPSVWWDFKYCE